MQQDKKYPTVDEVTHELNEVFGPAGLTVLSSLVDMAHWEPTIVSPTMAADGTVDLPETLDWALTYFGTRAAVVIGNDDALAECEAVILIGREMAVVPAKRPLTAE